MASADAPTDFGASLRQYRLAAGLSREALAERAGLSASAISALERGERRAPHADTVERLVKALDLSPAQAEALATSVDRHRAPARPAQRGPLPPGAVPTNLLISSLAPLIGRERELSEVSALLQSEAGEGRLLTLVGPPGVGKTRLALAIAERLIGIFPETVVIDLAPLREPDLVLVSFAARLGILEPGGPVIDRLVAALAGRRLLVVLDNFEQVLPAARELPALLARLPGLTLLVTSRTPLDLRVEQVYPVQPLALPDLARLPAKEELARVAAVHLFLERAHALGFAAEQTNAAIGTVAELVVHLDGLPLAIELAAARTRLLSPLMILERLGQRLSLLHWDAQDLPARQQTLAGAIAWSYDLLSPHEQALFRRLGVFSGGFTLDAAAAVMAESGGSGVDVVDGLATLVAASLVQSEADGVGGRRYWLLESMRDFALEQLAVNGEDSTAARAHAAYFLALTEEAEPALRGPGQAGWFRRLEQERQNVRAALLWLAESGDWQSELRLAVAAGDFFRLVRGNVVEGRRRLVSALRRTPETPSPLRAKALVALGEVLLLHGEPETARPLLTEALVMARALCAHEHAAEALIYLGRCDIDAGSLEAAGCNCEQALVAAEAAGDAWLIAYAQLYLGAVVILQGQPQRALTWLEDALRGYRACGDAVRMVTALSALGVAYGDAGDTARAVDTFQEALKSCGELHDFWLLNLTGERFALMAAGRVDDELLAELLGALDPPRRVRGVGRSIAQSRLDRLTTDLRARVGEPQFTMALERGRTCSFDQTVKLIGRLLDSMAGIE